jgi:hypothetical protein
VNVYPFAETETVTHVNAREAQFAGGYATIVQPSATVAEYFQCGFKPVEIDILVATTGVADHYDAGQDCLPLLYRKILHRVAAGDRTLIDNAPFLTSAAKTGTVTINADPGRKVVTGVGTAFTSEYAVGDYIRVNGETRLIESITSDTVLGVTEVFGSDSATQAHYLMTPATEEDDPADWKNQAGTAFAGVFPVTGGFILGSAAAINSNGNKLIFAARG